MLVGHFLFKRRKYKRVVITIDFFAIKMRALIATLKNMFAILVIRVIAKDHISTHSSALARCYADNKAECNALLG